MERRVLNCTRGFLEMIEEKWLAQTIFTAVRIQADLSQVSSGKDGDFQAAALSNVVNTPENNEATVAAWQDRAAKRKSTLVFCVDVRHVQDLTTTFRRHGVDAHHVLGETSAKRRSELVHAFKRGEFPVLLNCGVFTEGTDIPNIDSILLVRPTKSKGLLMQMIGRGARLYEGKHNFHVIDMVSSLKTGVVTFPSLLGLNPDELLQCATFEDIRTLVKQQEEREVEKLKAAEAIQPTRDFTGTLTFTEYDSVQDLIEDTARDRHIREMSPHAWVNVDNDRYVLSTNSGNYMSITKDETFEQWFITYTVKLPQQVAKRSPYMRPRLVGTALSLEAAINSADTYAREVFPFTFISKSQGWRRSPASKAQITILNKSRGPDHQLKDGHITKGMANDMITKLKVWLKLQSNLPKTSRLTMCETAWSKGSVRQAGGESEEDTKGAGIAREEDERSGSRSGWSN
jgi:ATP-dependent helicase IRC3